MRAALLLCAKDLRQRIRDRTGLLVAFAMPLVLSSLVGLAFGSSHAGVSLRLALVDEDGGPASQALREHLARPWLADVIELQEVASAADAEAVLADDEADAALVLRSGFTARAQTPDGPSVEVIASGSNPFATRMTIALAERVLSGEGPGPAPTFPTLHPISPSGRLRTLDFFAISMTVLFLTFTVLSGVRALQIEVEAGTLARLVASPASARSILGGKLLALLVTGWTQMGVMITVTSVVYGTRWGDPLPVTCLVLTTVWMAIGMTSFFMAIAKNAEQGQSLASISIFLLAVVGGQFMPPQGLPDVFDTLQRLTPNGQAARGFTDAAALVRDGGVAALWEPLLFTFTVGTLGIAVAGRRASRAVESALA